MAAASIPVTKELAAFVHDAPVGCASTRAIEVIKHAVLDLSGVIIAATEEEPSRLALDYARSQATAASRSCLPSSRQPSWSMPTAPPWSMLSPSATRWPID